MTANSYRCIRRQPSGGEYYEIYDNKDLMNFRKVLTHIVVQPHYVVKQLTTLTIVFTFSATGDTREVNEEFHPRSSHCCCMVIVSVLGFVNVFSAPEAVIFSCAFHSVVMASRRTDVEGLGQIRPTS